MGNFLAKAFVIFSGIGILISFVTFKIEVVHSFSSWGSYNKIELDVHHKGDIDMKNKIEIAPYSSLYIR